MQYKSQNYRFQESNERSPLILLYGPTASGKSSLAIALAALISGVVINADSRQVYEEIPIISAQPSQKDFETIEHKLYGFMDYDQNLNVKKWLELAHRECKIVTSSGKTPILVGGSGMYISTVLEGLIEFPELPAQKFKEFYHINQYVETIDLYHRLHALDPSYCDRLKNTDRQRILRALSVVELTGTQYSKYRAQENVGCFDDYNIISIYLKPERSELYRNIDSRFLAMLDQGMVEEVEALQQKYQHSKSSVNWNKATGLREIIAMLNGELSYDDMVAKSQQLTRNYAKRQYTWFNNRINHDLILEKPDLELLIEFLKKIKIFHNLLS